jgi:hypothetical protein
MDYKLDKENSMKSKWQLLITTTTILILYMLFQYQQADAIANSLSPILNDEIKQLNDDIKSNNKIVKTDTIQMPEAKRIDPELEEEMKSLLEASGCEKWKGQIYQVIIIDKDWFIERHKLTGAILYRYIRAEIAINSNNTCWLYQLVTFKQDYVKNTYGKTYWENSGDHIEVPCE